jgi:ABC-type uncharacterized transport system substrate-binding protein
MLPQQPSDKEYQYSVTGGANTSNDPYDRVDAAKTLMCLACYDTHYYTPAKFDKDVDLIVEHIKADRKRIMAPLVEYKKSIISDEGDVWGTTRSELAMEYALRLAGLKEGK